MLGADFSWRACKAISSIYAGATEYIAATILGGLPICRPHA